MTRNFKEADNEYLAGYLTGILYMASVGLVDLNTAAQDAIEEASNRLRAAA